jgi:glucose repression regulatory protein TUP1
MSLSLQILETPIPDQLNPRRVPEEFKKEGIDWLAVHNPELPKTMDVELVHTLTHDE